MEQVPQLLHPNTLEEHREYLFIENGGNAGAKDQIPVKLYAYDPCPAFVIVSNRLGKKWRCLRDELYVKALSGPY